MFRDPLNLMRLAPPKGETAIHLTVPSFVGLERSFLFCDQSNDQADERKRLSNFERMASGSSDANADGHSSDESCFDGAD
jgi:hypothetical protein